MNLVKCSNGHYYDGEKFESCPHCEGVNRKNAVGLNEETMDLESLKTISEQKNTVSATVADAAVIKQFDDTDDVEMTIGIGSYYAEDNSVKVNPVVGWLVCIEGSEVGNSFNLKAGKNFIGRNAAVNDIIIKGDQSISREKHAIIVYDPKSGSFLAHPGTSSELFYINDKVILQATSINDRDIIVLGNTKLVFVPFCDDNFSW